MKELNLVRDWHLKYGVPVVMDSNKVKRDRIVLRKALLKEEMNELFEAHVGGNILEIAKECADLLFVVLGTALEFGYQDFFEDQTMYETEIMNANAEESIGRIQDVVLYFQGTNYTSSTLFQIYYDLDEYIRFTFSQEQFDRVFLEVHKSNMSKGTNGKPVIREDGKILKGDDYIAADLSFLVK